MTRPQQPNLDQSLYSRRKSRATREAVDAVNAEAARVGLIDSPGKFGHDRVGLWGTLTTLREKRDYLEAFKKERGL